LILLGVPPLGGYNYITPRRAGLSATAGLSCSTNLCRGSGKQEHKAYKDDGAWQRNEVVIVFVYNSDVNDVEDDQKHVQNDKHSPTKTRPNELKFHNCYTILCDNNTTTTLWLYLARFLTHWISKTILQR